MIEKNAHQGERCFIIASGPSIKGMDLSWLKDEITICVNQSYKLLDFEPTYICISDIALWGAIHPTYAKMKNTKVVACFSDVKKIIKEYPGKNLGMVFRNLGRKVPIGSYSYDLSRGMPSARNVVPTVAIPFANWCAFKSIYLIGCDCTNLGYAYKNGLRDKHQFFDDITLKYYEAISKVETKSTIYNATIGGRLECFPRVKFDLLKRKLKVVGYYTPNGDYKNRAQAMKKSVEQWGIECHVEEMPQMKGARGNTRLQWALNANICPAFVKKMRKKFHDYDLFCLDVDAEMLHMPELLLDNSVGFDFGAVFINNCNGFWQMCGGGLYFAASKKANELIDKWVLYQSWRNDDLRKDYYKPPYLLACDQETLQAVIPLISDLSWVEFPEEYGYIIPTSKGRAIMQHIENPVIKHYQASRINRRG